MFGVGVNAALRLEGKQKIYSLWIFTLQVGGNDLHRIWPFLDNVNIRTREDVIHAVQEVNRTNRPVSCRLNFFSV